MPPFSGSATTRRQYAVGTWILSGPTTAGFGVANFGVKRVTGTIPMTSAYVEVAEDGTVSAVDAVLNIAAIDTANARRDKDLHKPALLDLANHPQLTFGGTHVAPHEGGWTVTGLLTVKGATREITLEATTQQEHDGSVRVLVTGQLDRRDYGITAPRFLIGAIVDIDIDVTLRRR